MKPLLIVTVAFLLSASTAVAAEIEPEAVLAEINKARVASGVEPLQLDERLTLAADDRMRDMEEQGYWSHYAPDGGSPFHWLTARQFRYAFAGENLARGFETAEVMIQAWLESPGHRTTMLSTKYTLVGISAIDGYTTGRAVGKSVVALFAREAAGISVATN